LAAQGHAHIGRTRRPAAPQPCGASRLGVYMHMGRSGSETFMSTIMLGQQYTISLLPEKETPKRQSRRRRHLANQFTLTRKTTVDIWTSRPRSQAWLNQRSLTIVTLLHAISGRTCQRRQGWLCGGKVGYAGYGPDTYGPDTYGPDVYGPAYGEPPPYEPPSYEPPLYEPPSYEPPSYEPPSYEPVPKY